MWVATLKSLYYQHNHWLGHLLRSTSYNIYLFYTHSIIVLDQYSLTFYEDSTPWPVADYLVQFV